MGNRQAFASLCAAIESERSRPVRASPDALARERAKLAIEEIRSSARLAGARLDLIEVAALVDRGVALGDHRLADYIITADYAEAARAVAAAPMPGRKQPYLRVDEIVEAHERATRRNPAANPGAFRTTTATPLPSGMVPAPPWLVPREIGSFVDRIAPGPPPATPALLWVADAHERFERIRPFTAGNGRAGRLILNLLLRRCGYPAFAVRDRDAARYLNALHRADTRDPWPLAMMIAKGVFASLLRLSACEASQALASLASFAAGADRDALYKAAQRGRLRAVRRNGALLTTQAWIDEYRAPRRARSTRTPVPGTSSRQ